MYKVSSVYAPDHDSGILWNSAAIPWPDSSPDLSARDARFPTLDSFSSPFHYQDEGRSA
jgi:dTDP-4-dehydrorhamnose 3,5-epimerase